MYLFASIQNEKGSKYPKTKELIMSLMIVTPTFQEKVDLGQQVSDQSALYFISAYLEKQ